MSEAQEDYEKKVCEELYWLWKTIDFAKQELREMQDKKMIIDKDYAEMLEKLTQAERKVWEMKKTYKCIR